MKNDKIKNHPIKAIKRAAVSLCAFETADPAATIRGIMANLGNEPVCQWDCARGLTALNAGGISIVSGCGNPDPQFPLDQILTLLSKTEAVDSLVFMHSAHRFITNEFVAQALWNLRDVWKANGNTIVLLAPSITLPAELQQDVVVVSEEAPTQDEIEQIVHGVADSAGMDDVEDKTHLVDATLGYLSGFAVEQSLSLSVRKNGKAMDFDMDKLWQLKVQNLKQTAGLEVSLPKETFADLAGCAGYKNLTGKFLNGKEPPRAVLWLDEIEKMVAGSTGGDMSGVSQGLVEQFLNWTETRRVKGMLLVGVPGAGKSMSARCTAGESKVPLLRASMSTVKGSLVGQSEQQMKSLLKAVDAVAQGRVLMIATCNGIESLSPEVMARFKLATFFYDFPTDEEATALWKLYKGKYELKDATPTGTRNWVGREIESCCERAWLFNCSLAEAAKSVVPVCTSNAAKMDTLRQSVSGRFLSASEMKTFTFNPNAVSSAPTGRRIQ